MHVLESAGRFRLPGKPIRNLGAQGLSNKLLLNINHGKIDGIDAVSTCNQLRCSSQATPTDVEAQHGEQLHLLDPASAARSAAKRKKVLNHVSVL